MRTRNGLILGVLLMGALATSASAVEPTPLPHNSPTPGEGYAWSIAACDGYTAIGRPFDGVGGSVAIVQTSTNTIVDELFATNSSLRFGHSVAFARNCSRLVVGAPSDATRGTKAGGIHVYSRSSPGQYVWETTLYGADTATNDELGQSVAISPSGNTVVGGAHPHDKAYVFWPSGASWSQKKLAFSGAEAGDYIGYSLAATDTRVVIGAPNDFNQSGANWWFGTVYVHDRNIGGTNNWGQRHRIAPTNTWLFGWSVAMTGNSRRIAVGAPGHGSAPGGRGPGKVYVLLLSANGSSWSTEQTLLSPTPQNDAEFGTDVDIWSGQLAVGERLRDITGAANSGLFHLYTKSTGAPWTIQASARPTSVSAEDKIGWTVAVQAGRVWGGAPFSDRDGIDAGAGFVYSTNKVFEDGFDLGDTSEWNLTLP